VLDESRCAHAVECPACGPRDYNLDEEDRDILDSASDDPDAVTYLLSPSSLAIVGRPNVDQAVEATRQPSSAVAKRKSFGTPPVYQRPRDSWASGPDARFTLVDTGGCRAGPGHQRLRRARSGIAIDLADAVLFVVDGRHGPGATSAPI
jgi:GTP-binding protein